jgi:hypothetical protein
VEEIACSGFPRGNAFVQKAPRSPVKKEESWQGQGNDGASVCRARIVEDALGQKALQSPVKEDSRQGTSDHASVCRARIVEILPFEAATQSGSLLAGRGRGDGPPSESRGVCRGRN